MKASEEAEEADVDRGQMQHSFKLWTVDCAHDPCSW